MSVRPTVDAMSLRTARFTQVTRFIPSSAPPAAGVRLDLAIHALAQLTDPITLDLVTHPSARRSLALLARAYGVDERVQFGPDLVSVDAAKAVYTSPRDTTSVWFPVGDTASTAQVLARVGADPARAEEVHSMAELVGALQHPDSQAAACRGRDDVLAGQRVVIVVNRPTHYRVPVLNRLSRRLTAAGGTLCVLFTDDLEAKPWMRPEPMDFEHFGLDSRASAAGLPAIPLDLERRLRQIRPTLVLAGGLSPTVAGRIAHFGHRRGISFGVWSGEIDTRSTAQNRLRRRQRQWLLRKATFGVAYGSRSGEYLRQLMPGLQLVYARNTAPVPTLRPRTRRSSTVEVLTVGRALPLKRLDVLVAAFKLLTDAPCRLTVVGDGPSLPALREQGGSLDNVRFLGTLPSDRVAEAYSEADAFIFPSCDDVFGLVLVEAMGAGLATIVSSRPGAVADLLVPGRNGLVIDGYEPSAWAAAIRSLVEDPARRQALGRAARDTIMGRWTLDHSADALVAGLRLGVLASAEAPTR